MKKQRCKDSKTSARKGQKESGSQLVLLVLHGGTCQTALGFIPTAAFFSELKSSGNQTDGVQDTSTAISDGTGRQKGSKQ